MTRILYVITELDIGGAENALFELATRIDPELFQPEVACLHGQGPLAERLHTRGVPVHLLGAQGKGELVVGHFLSPKDGQDYLVGDWKAAGGGGRTFYFRHATSGIELALEQTNS